MQVRLMLVLAPAACCLAGVAVHEALKVLMKSVRQADTPAASEQEVESKLTKSPVKTPPASVKKGKSATKVSAVETVSYYSTRDSHGDIIRILVDGQ